MHNTWLRCCLWLGVLIVVPTISRAQSTTSVTAFVDVAVIPMDREQVLSGYTVLIEGDRIAAMDKAEKVRVPIGATIIDGRGLTLMPGLVDAHMHISFGEAASEEELSPQRKPSSHPRNPTQVPHTARTTRPPASPRTDTSGARQTQPGSAAPHATTDRGRT